MRTRRTGTLVAGILAVALVALVAWAAWPPSEKPYHELVARLRAAGEPVDYDALSPRRGPVSENGAAGLRAAREWLTANVRGEAWTTLWNALPADAPTPEPSAELAAVVDRLTPFFELVAGAASKPHLQYLDERRDSTGFPAGAEWFLRPSYLSLVGDVGHVLAACAFGARDANRRTDAIVWNTAIAVRLDCVSAQDHTTAAATASVALLSIRREMERGRLDPAAARARLDPLLREPWIRRVPALARAQRAILVQSYRAILDGTYPIPASMRTTWYERLLHGCKCGGHDADDELLHAGMAPTVVRSCELMSRAALLPPSGWRDYRTALQAATGEVGAADGWFPTIAREFVRLDAAQGLARIALAVAEFSTTRGDFPASLDDLRPMFADGVPIDPFTDAPFVYQRTSTGVRIASLGRLATDPAEEDTELRERGLVWELKR